MKELIKENTENIFKMLKSGNIDSFLLGLELAKNQPNELGVDFEKIQEYVDIITKYPALNPYQNIKDDYVQVDGVVHLHNCLVYNIVYAKVEFEYYNNFVFEDNLSHINDYAAKRAKSLNIDLNGVRSIESDVFMKVFNKFNGIEFLSYEYSGDLVSDIDLSENNLPNIRQISFPEISILDKIKYSEQVYSKVQNITWDLSHSSIPNAVYTSSKISSISLFKNLKQFDVVTYSKKLGEIITEEFNKCVKAGVISADIDFCIIPF